MKKIFLSIILSFFAGIFSSFAQEVIIPDTISSKRDVPVAPSLLIDSSMFQLTPPVMELPSLKNPDLETPLLDRPSRTIIELENNDPWAVENIIPPKFKPSLNFGLGASRWELPVLGTVTTFSPSLNYRLTENLTFYGGVNVSQYHNLSYIQSIVAPGFPTRSNITSDAFVGASYRLWDRIILHGSYQRSLYNELPSNMMMFAPGQNIVTTGASVDVWNGLGVTVEHVWEFDDYGRKRQGFRYSPYIDFPKLMKFFGYGN